MRVGSAWRVLKGTVKEFNEDKALRLSASLAYYAIFSIGPLLFLLVVLAGAVFGEDAVRKQIHEQLQGFMGPQAAKTVESMMEARQLGGGLVTTILGIFSLVLGATGVFGQLQDALNTIFEVQPKPEKGFWSYIRTRFLSMSMVLGLGFLLLISLVLTTAAQAAASGLGSILPVPEWVMGVISALAAFVVVTLFFAFVFKLLPDVKVRWRPVWVGALITGLLFTAGKFLMALYLGRQATASSYGAAGSVVVLLLWVYYASVILFFGAELTQVYASKIGARIVPDEHAEPSTEESRAEQGMPRRDDAHS